MIKRFELWIERLEDKHPVFAFLLLGMTAYLLSLAILLLVASIMR